MGWTGGLGGTGRAEKAQQLGVDSVWMYDPVITPRLIEALGEINIEVIAWTVDDATRIEQLVEMGVAGICSNDPRLFPARSKSKKNAKK